MGHLQERHEVGQPEQQAQVQDHRRRHRTGRARRRRRRSPSSATRSTRSRSTTRRGGPTRSPRRAASTPRRTTAATATRSIGCSTTRSRAATSAPASPTSTGSPGQRRHHRPDGRAGCAVRPGVRRPARQPQLRWRAGQPHVLRTWPDGTAVVARRLPAARAPDRPRRREAVQPRRARRHGRDRRPVRRHRHPRPDQRRDPVARRARRGAVHGRLRQRVLPVDQRDELQRHRRVARAPQGRVLRQPVLHADPPDVHPAGRRHAVASSR